MEYSVSGMVPAVSYIKKQLFCCLHRIIEENSGKAPLTYNRMQVIVKTLGPPKRPVPAPTIEDMQGTTTRLCQ